MFLFKMSKKIGYFGSARFRLFRRKLKHFKFLLTLISIFITFIITYKIIFAVINRERKTSKTPWTSLGTPDPYFNPNATSDENEIVILKWTTLYGSSWGAHNVTSRKCPYIVPPPQGPQGKVFDKLCRITSDRRYLRRSHALLVHFHALDLMSPRDHEELPPTRPDNQLWVYVTRECPKMTGLNLQEYPNVFNWTMTYRFKPLKVNLTVYISENDFIFDGASSRLDSDVYHPYDYFAPTTEPLSDKVTSQIRSNQSFAARPKLVAWIVSHCNPPSKRQYFVAELQKYIPVSIFGVCAELDCVPKKNCYAYVSETHKFYLSLENSLCSDYITEKLFNPLKYNLVPVVYGGSDSQDYSQIAPEHSYIDARNFSSAKQLAEYLLYLDGNDAEYLRYFEWKSKYRSAGVIGWCNLCQRIYEHLQSLPKSSEESKTSLEGRSKYKWYEDPWNWWDFRKGLPACQLPIEKLTGSTTRKLDFGPPLWKIGREVFKWIFKRINFNKYYSIIKRYFLGL